MELDIDTVVSIGSWLKVERKSSMNAIKITWVFKFKSFPNGVMRKLKARFCVRGYMQIEDIDFVDTFVPVIQWTNVRTLLIISLQLTLATAQVDTAAFPQS